MDSYSWRTLGSCGTAIGKAPCLFATVANTIFYRVYNLNLLITGGNALSGKQPHGVCIFEEQLKCADHWLAVPIYELHIMKSTGFGGGMCNISNSSPTLTNCTFTGNAAGGSGGGMYNYYSSPTLTNCTFTNNTTVGKGGGMYNSLVQLPDADKLRLHGQHCQLRRWHVQR